ncbi:MAG TPA: phosphoheptose isomerase [Nitrospiraceae bacterium]|nr:MAG: phosphoheptose isomerase [Nitrospirae bacterium RIFCSPLOWO2_02_42_7]HBI22624.1 phosphoheptose isomerase [Nitrospiraceae bacterium]
MDTEDKIRALFKESIKTKEAFISCYAGTIKEVSELIVSSFKKGNKLILMGNGGSSTDASHIAAEFVNRFQKDRPPLPAIALNTDMAVMTSIGNDYSFSLVFKRQMEVIAKEGDVVIAISTSGNSPNVLEAIKAAGKLGTITVGFTGGSGGKLASLVDYAFIVQSTVTPRIQEVHITLGHTICQIVEEMMFGETQ